MSALAPTLQAFFTDRLLRQRHVSPETVAAYRDGLRLFVGFASQVARKSPSQLDFADLEATVVASFLDHLEHDRRNSVRTRNARLAAVHSLYRCVALHCDRMSSTAALRVNIR
jgi:site-specific recombinase XerD